MRRHCSLTGNVYRICLNLVKATQVHGPRQRAEEFFWILTLLGVVFSCGATEPLPAARGASFDPQTLHSGIPKAGIRWAAFTQSPGRRRTIAHLPGCQSEERLTAVAQQLAEAQARGDGRKELSEVVFLLRAAGIPHVSPRYWSVEGPNRRREAMQTRLERWVTGVRVVGQLRCGMAIVSAAEEADKDGKLVVVALAVNVLAELSPFPTFARVGQLLTLQARGLVEGTEARVVLLGPSGPPRSVGAGLSASRYRASFGLTESGLWKVQLVASYQTGPRPIAEAWISVGQSQPSTVPEFVAPGEEHGSSGLLPSSLEEARASLLRMINTTRDLENLPLLHRTKTLDKLAQEHADAMRDQGTTAHNVGGGGPSERLRKAGVSAKIVSENVGQAGDLVLVHRALYNSPSHRQTLLHPPFRQVGIGVSWVGQADGSEALESTTLGDSQPAVRHEGGADVKKARSRPSSVAAPTVWVAELFVDHGTVLK